MLFLGELSGFSLTSARRFRLTYLLLCYPFSLFFLSFLQFGSFRGLRCSGSSWTNTMRRHLSCRGELSIQILSPFAQFVFNKQTEKSFSIEFTPDYEKNSLQVHGVHSHPNSCRSPSACHVRSTLPVKEHEHRDASGISSATGILSRVRQFG